MTYLTTWNKQSPNYWDFFLKIKSGTRKIAQPINHLPFRHEDLGKQRQADLQYLLLPSFIYLSRSRSVWDPVSNTMVRSVWGAKSKGVFWLPHICTFMCNHRQEYEHLCTHTQKTQAIRIWNISVYCILYYETFRKDSLIVCN